MTTFEYKSLEHLAAEQDVSLSWITRRAINEYLEKHGTEAEMELPFQ